MDTEEKEDLVEEEVPVEDSKHEVEEGTVDKPDIEVKVDSDEEVEADSKRQGTEHYDDYNKLSEKEKVKYGF